MENVMQNPRGIPSNDITSTINGPLERQKRLDPRSSFIVLLLMNIQMGVSTSIGAEVASVFLCACCFVYCGRVASLIKWLAFYLAFAVISFCLMLSESTLLSPFAATFMVYRHAFPLFMFASNMIATTRVGELACALQKLRLSSKLTVALCVALRFFPTIWREFKVVSDAMKIRGIGLSLASVVRHPVETMEHLLVPVIGRLGTVADELGNAVVVRGVETERKRTSYYRLRLNVFDILVVLGAVAVLCLAILGKIGMLPWL